MTVELKNKVQEKVKQAAAAIATAMQSGDEEKIQEAWLMFHESVAEKVRQDVEDVKASQDTTILMQRGYRQLTSTETKWYQKVISALKTKDWKQAFTTIIGAENEEDLMPTTIIEDVYKNLQEEYPLLGAINFQYAGYLTKWILHDHTKQAAVWGTITAEIVKEITSAFKAIDITQLKLSAFAVIEKGMLDLGPIFLDGYIRAVLKEAMYLGLEYGAVSGTGHEEPIGMIRDIHEGVTVNSSTGYPAKTKIVVTSFTPQEYGALVAQMAETEGGSKRNFKKVYLLCNMTDYLTKIMPATTLLTPNGTYVANIFPFPTDVIIANSLSDGEAVLVLLEEYMMVAGGSKDGTIEVDDSVKFFEDARAFKIKQYAFGRCFDDTSALYLDISGLDPAYITVRGTIAVDKSELLTAIQSVEALTEEDYSVETWADVASAYAVGQTVYASGLATQYEVNIATSAITTAIAALEAAA